MADRVKSFFKINICSNDTIDDYVSVNSKPDHPPRAIFLMGEFPTPRAKKEFKTPTPRAYQNDLKPHPRAFFSIIHYKNMKKWDKNHVKLQDFIIFRWLKDKLGLQLSPRLHQANLLW